MVFYLEEQTPEKNLKKNQFYFITIIIIYYNILITSFGGRGTHKYVQKEIMKYQRKVQNFCTFWIETKIGLVGLLSKKYRELTIP